jgi:O-antigen/teichoic acid export membrane protein
VATTDRGVPEPVAAGPGMPSIARGGLVNLVGAAVSAVTGVLLVVVVTRTLPQSDAGAFFALTSVFLLAETVARLGTGTGVVYFVARLRSLGQPERIRAVQRVALTPVVTLSAIVATALAIWAPQIAEFLGTPADGTRSAIVALALLLPVAALSDTLLAATRGHGAMLPTAAVDRVGRPLLQLTLVAVAVSNGSAAVLAGAWALPWVLSAALAWWWLLRLTRCLPPAAAGGPGLETWREFWSFTAPRAVNSLVQLALQRLDIVLVTALAGPAEAAVYTAATRFLVVGQLTTSAISTAAQPRLAGVLAVGDHASARSVYQSATAWVVLLTWPLYLLCGVFADTVLTVFGAGYEAGRPVVLVLVGATLLATACGMVDMLLNMAGRTSWTLANSVVALAVMVVVDLALIPRLGILGAGIGWAAAIVVNNLLPLGQLLASTRLHPFGAATVRGAALSAVCFGILPVTALLLVPGNAAATTVAALVGLALFVVALRRWRAALGLPALRTVLTRTPRRTTARRDVDRARTGEIQ